MVTPAFPNRDALCERCGYPLHGLAASGACPECGQSITDSAPTRRHGPPWQQRMTLANWAVTLRDLALRPRRTFRAMQVHGSNVPARLFLLSLAVLIGAAWAGLELLVGREPPVLAWARAMAAVNLVIGLSYIEALGVRYFSHRRGWRVPWRVAERVVAYAAIGWLPAAAVLGKLYLLHVNGTLDRWLTPLLGARLPGQMLVITMLVFSLAILGFETLVWVGVRQVRYANAPAK